jgi:Kip1 ubiquitination-promoting complex protein 1
VELSESHAQLLQQALDHDEPITAEQLSLLPPEYLELLQQQLESGELGSLPIAAVPHHFAEILAASPSHREGSAPPQPPAAAAAATPPPRPAPSGRLGPKDVVMVDVRGSCENIDGCLLSKANFSTVRANVAVFRGKWLYEVQLDSSGILQIGWTPQNARFTSEEGIGDSAHSYAYDGKRQRKWNVNAAPYGDRWTAGDVITCGIDMDTGTIKYWRNGKDLGDAFTNIRRRVPNGAYLPGISLSYGERCEVNFGDRPFAYPQEGYSPLQAPPSAVELAQAEYISGCWSRLLQVTEKGAKGPSSPAAAAALAAERAVASGGYLEKQQQRRGGEEEDMPMLMAGGLEGNATDEEMELEDPLAVAAVRSSGALDDEKKKAQQQAAAAAASAGGGTDSVRPRALGGEGEEEQEEAPLPHTDSVLLAAALARHTGMLCCSKYFVNATMLPLFYSFVGAAKSHQLIRLVGLLPVVLEEEELIFLAGAVCTAIGRHIKACVSDTDDSGGESDGFKGMDVWLVCLQDPLWATAWTSNKSWMQQMEALLSVRQPTAADLGDVLPNLDWEEDDDYETILAEAMGEGVFAADVASVSSTLRSIEEFQTALLGALCCVPANRGITVIESQLNETNWVDEIPEEMKNALPYPPPALKIFIEWLSTKNAGASRNIPPPGLSHSSVLVSTFFGLLRLLRPWLNRVHIQGEEFLFSTSVFFKGKMGGGTGEDVPRLGGTLSHLVKEHYITLTPEVVGLVVPATMDSRPQGPLDWVPTEMELPSGFLNADNDNNNNVFEGVQGVVPLKAVPSLSGTPRKNATAGVAGLAYFGPLWTPPSDSSSSGAGASNTTSTTTTQVSCYSWQWWLVYHLLNFYSLGVAARVRFCFTHLNTLEQALNSLRHMNERMDSERNTGGRELLRLSIAECRKTVEDSLRQHAWHSSWLTPAWKQEGTLAIAAVTARILEQVASEEGQLLAYVQEPILEAVLDMMHAARRSESRAWKTAAEVDSFGMDSVVSCIITLCDDDRIVSPEAKSILLQSLWAMISDDECLGPISKNATAQRHLLAALIHNLKDQRNWVQAANTLGLLVYNVGFGHVIQHPLSLKAAEEAWVKATKVAEEGEVHRAVMRSWLAPTLRNDPALCSAFFNALFDNVNWTVTELVVVLEELSGMSSSDRNASHLQRRGAATGDLCMLLLRLQELACMEIPEQILGRGKGLNATRLAEIVAFGLRQFTPDGKLDKILQRKGLKPNRNRPAQDRRMRATLAEELLTAYLGSIYALELTPITLEAVSSDPRGVKEEHLLSTVAENNDRIQNTISALPSEPPLAHHSLVPALFQQSVTGDTLGKPFERVFEDWEAEVAAIMAHTMADADHSHRERYFMYEPLPRDSKTVFGKVISALRAAEGTLAGGGGEGAMHGDAGGSGGQEDEPPDAFLDPIMQTIMDDPVLLPNSGITVDRSTIERHLLSSQTDPFSRAPLSMEELKPDEPLKLRIDAWLAGDRSIETIGISSPVPMRRAPSAGIMPTALEPGAERLAVERTEQRYIAQHALQMASQSGGAPSASAGADAADQHDAGVVDQQEEEEEERAAPMDMDD